MERLNYILIKFYNFLKILFDNDYLNDSFIYQKINNKSFSSDKLYSLTNFFVKMFLNTYFYKYLSFPTYYI